MFVCVMVVVSILWIPVIANMQGAQLYIYIQAIAAYLSPPIAAIYLLAVLWKRGNEKVSSHYFGPHYHYVLIENDSVHTIYLSSL